MYDEPMPRPRAKPQGELPFPLQDSERVLKLCRRHWIYLWPRTIMMAVLAVGVVIARRRRAVGDGGLAAWRARFLDRRVAWLLYWAVRIFLNWYRYHNDIWVVTNQRIVDSFKTDAVQARLSTADLVNVQDMTVETNGIVANDVELRRYRLRDSGRFPRIPLVGIPRPQEVQLLDGQGARPGAHAPPVKNS